MAIKADLASELYSVTLEKLTANEEEWRNYLDVASYTYQYSFADQVLIYAQRPHARAVADYDTWNEKIGRWIHKNKEAITLLDYTGKKIERRFVFDISDTYQKFGKEYKLWQITEEDNDKLYEELENAFGNLKNKENLGQTLISAINNVYEDNIKEYYEELISSTEYSALKEFNEVKIKEIFENIIKSTLIYEVFTRCDIEPYTYLDKDCFENIKYFDSTLLKYSLGTTCNDLSRTIIKKIKEYANNKTYTFAKENTEEYSIYEERSVEDGTIIQNEEIRNIERGNGSNRGNILKSEGEVPKGTQKSSISNDDSKTGIDTTSKPDARRRNKYGGSSDRKDEEGTEYNREIKARRSDDVGTTNEQYKITSTRNSNEGTDIQLNIFNNEVETKKKVSTFFMPENEKIEKNQFQIKDEGISEDNLKTRYKNNIEAIKIQIICDNEKRIATKEEQEKLAKYVGWGGMPQVFDDKNVSWSKEYKELKSLLTENEYEKARASTLTAFYTPPIVIENIYKTIENFGFKGGNILEPSCGIGNFIGMLPESMKDSMFYGVELDEITGEIAKLLYPKSKIEIKGFEETSFKDNTFDLAIGNVPFGDFRITDSRYDKNNFLIHDYFFAKTIDKVRSSGIIAFITSKGTLDKENENVRKYIAERAKFLGAVRLPNNTFTKNAGTEVTSDIIFLQKREEKIENVDELWIHTTKNEDGISVNNYFLQNPNQVVGKLNTINTRFGKDVACILEQSDNFKELLNKASENIKGEYKVYEADETYIKPIDIDNIEDKNIRNFSYIIKDNKMYFKENNELNFVDVNTTAKQRIKGLIELRESTRLLINLQLNDSPENLIKEEQVRLNFLYDEFNKNYGRINSRANKSVFSEDSSYYLLCSLEILNDKGEFLRKADMFKKRTIQPHKEITHCNSSKEALILSVSEKAKIDLEYMQNLTNKSKEELIEDLKGTIFKLPYSEEYVLADEYLSGNVREKLKVVQNAIHSDENLKINEDYLKQVLPKNIEASEITAKLGSTWIPKEYIEEFMHELLKTPRYRRMDIIVNYSEKTASWNISGKSYDRGNVLAYSTYGTDRINAYKIIEDILNLRNVKIFDNLLDEEGNKVRKLNKKETAIAQSKQEQIKEAFEDWIFKDPDRREKLVTLYNEKFNSIKLREYNGEHITFGGMNPEIQLRKHQQNAIAHILYGGNTLLAHEVGAGKTFEMVAAAMESKRLGLCNKSLFVVPNHIVEQFASEFLQLYTSANLLVATQKDFTTSNRKRFCSKIATGDYDAIIIGHSQFEKIPMSIERQKEIISIQISDILQGIKEIKEAGGENYSIKELEKSKKRLEEKMKKLNDQSKKDDVITFEELGVDRMFVDEAHNYKNLFLYTKMRNVSGIAQTEAQKSSDLYMKCRYLDEITNNRGVVFATGTPVSNSMTELYTMQKYLQYDSLKECNLQHFDAWASTFGETVTAIELSPEGTGYRTKTRFAKFNNLPELMSLFKEVADIQTSETLHLPVPEAEFNNVVVKPSVFQKEMVESLGERAEKVRNGEVEPNVDNMLKITNDGRKLALDQRLVNELLPDFDEGKIMACAKNIYDNYSKTDTQRLAQLVFCDLSTPKDLAKSNEIFNELEKDKTKVVPFIDAYTDLKCKLIRMGVDKNEIAFIHEADNEEKKKELFSKVRSGNVRVLIGSTSKMGAGTNVQKKLIALHDLDCPWRPADLTQRLGRIVRQGNTNSKVHIYRYVTEGTFDAYLYQIVENKQKFISQIMTSKTPMRSAEDVDETALSYAEIKALAAGNPLIIEKTSLDSDVTKLKLLKQNYLNQKYSLEDKIIKYYPLEISNKEKLIDNMKKDLEVVKESQCNYGENFPLTIIEGKPYGEKDKAGEAIISTIKNSGKVDKEDVGTYRGFKLGISFDTFTSRYLMTIKNNSNYLIELGGDVNGNITRLENALNNISSKIEKAEQELGDLKNQLENANVEVQAVFKFDSELKEKSKRLDEVNALLNIDEKGDEVIEFDGEEEKMEVKLNKDIIR